ncbi:MAG: hypothetical protein VCA36_07430 [Opitutales bacterium]
MKRTGLEIRGEGWLATSIMKLAHLSETALIWLSCITFVRAMFVR